MSPTITGIVVRREGGWHIGTKKSHMHDEEVVVESFRVGQFPDPDSEWGILLTWSDGTENFFPGREITRVSFAAPERRR